MSRGFQLPEAAVPCRSVWAKVMLASMLRAPNLEYRSSEVALDGLSKRELTGGLLGDSLKGGCRSIGNVTLLGGCSNLLAGPYNNIANGELQPLTLRLCISKQLATNRKGNMNYLLLLWWVTLLFISNLRVHWSYRILCDLPAWRPEGPSQKCPESGSSVISDWPSVLLTR